MRPHVGTRAFLSREAGPGVNTNMMPRVNGGAYPTGRKGPEFPWVWSHVAAQELASVGRRVIR
jgi:hypothetical protein